jgi:membrane associated rhomboid family serine protease
MFPVSDVIPSRTTPVVTMGLIAANVLVFFYQLLLPDAALEQFVGAYAVIPAWFWWPSLFTSQFLHSGWMHILWNMVYLWIFGDNVEDRFGHVKFLIFYLLCGIAATFAQYYVSPGSTIPNVGASGAIAGVLGAYILMFPQARVNVLVGNQMVAMPALIVLGFWIVLQLFSGVGSIAYTDESTRDMGGVAYMAHVGGFVAGFLMAFLFRGGSGGNPRLSA